jgi:hypothetical protein
LCLDDTYFGYQNRNVSSIQYIKAAEIKEIRCVDKVTYEYKQQVAVIADY